MVAETKRVDYSKEVTMKRVWFWVSLVSIALFLGGPVISAFGQAPKPPDIEQRLANQEKRIDQAVQAKELTPDDAKLVQDNVNKIKQDWTRLKTENKLTKEERDKLNARLDQNSELINQKRQATAKAAPVAPAKPVATAPAPAQAAGTAPAKAVSPAPVQPAVTTPAKPVLPVAKETPAPEDPRIQQKIADQQKQIDQGIRTKELTLHESNTLQTNLNQIKDEVALVRTEKKFTKEENDRFNQLLDQNGKMITDKRNNPVRDLAPDMGRGRSIEWRFGHQTKRIDNGVRLKQLTDQEAKTLRDNLTSIRNRYEGLKAGGKELTPDQREELQILLDQNSRMIQKDRQQPVKKMQ